MLVPWMGGASSPPVAVAGGGARSMLAFWMGGASALVGDIVAPVPTIPVSRKVGDDDRRRSRDENDVTALLQFLILSDIL